MPGGGSVGDTIAGFVGTGDAIAGPHEANARPSTDKDAGGLAR